MLPIPPRHPEFRRGEQVLICSAMLASHQRRATSSERVNGLRPRRNCHSVARLWTEEFLAGTHVAGRHTIAECRSHTARGYSLMFGPDPRVLTTVTPVGLVALTMMAGCSGTAPHMPQTLDGHAALVIA